MRRDDGPMTVPPPGQEVRRQPISIRFDLDCGELVPGHHFIARGVSFEEMVSPEAMTRIEPPRGPNAVERRRNRSYLHAVVVPEGGFTDDDKSDDAQWWRSWRRWEAQIAAAPRIRGVCLHYELAPGIPASADADDDNGWFRYLVGVEFHSDVPLATDDDDSGLMEPATGGQTTYGERGPWPLANGARVLTFALLGRDSGRSGEDIGGRLVVDIVDGTAHWISTAS